MKLLHFGCSFAMGNGIPNFIKSLPAEVAPKLHWKTKAKRQQMFTKYKDKLKNIEEPMSCGKHIANALNFAYTREADNGISNEMIFRRLISTAEKQSFVLIGLTGYNRREGLTTADNNSHWHTWKQVDANDPVGYKDLAFDPWINKEETNREFGLLPVSKPANGKYDAIVIAVAHDEFKQMTINQIKLLGKDNHIIYDVKYLFEENQVDGRL